MFLSGEKIGIEYLYSQTGEVLQSPLEPEDTEGMNEDVEDLDDEGFHVRSFFHNSSLQVFSFYCLLLPNILGIR